MTRLAIFLFAWSTATALAVTIDSAGGKLAYYQITHNCGAC